MKEIKDFSSKLREERDNISRRLNFMLTHKFDKEADFLRERIKVINVILYEIERVGEKRGKGKQAEFIFD